MDQIAKDGFCIFPQFLNSALISTGTEMPILYLCNGRIPVTPTKTQFVQATAPGPVQYLFHKGSHQPPSL
ncbi:hypothetical protein D3Z53_21600 [Lachnospiraceae bacterium]|nr:hypothetical protein [Lachnospiraceae bacterium]